ncbi:cytochrome c3 family protein [Thermodesulfobacteriota bacterium]
MKKRLLTFAVISVFITTMIAATPSYIITIEKTGSKEGAVTFNHRKHKKHAIYVDKCKTCHHVGKWHQACGEPGCHSDPKKDSGGERIHMTCLERCHAESEAKAPTDCTDCHK